MDLNEFKIKAMKKEKILSIRASKKDYEWLKKYNISPTKIFNIKLEELKRSRK